MIEITNEKISGFDPFWAPFRGFTLLFDNPGINPAQPGELTYIDCDVAGNHYTQLYRAFQNGITRIGLDHLASTYHFYHLPPSSYHVTVWDGINEGNIDCVTPEWRVTCARYLRELPESLAKFDLFQEIASSDLVSKSDWDIQLKFESLEHWGNVSLVARIGPANGASAEAMLRLVSARAKLSQVFAQKFGVSSNPIYVPHVTLGYFANRDIAKQANSSVDNWNRVFIEMTEGLTLQLRRVSFYGFTDMATFFTIRQNLGPEEN